MWKIACQTLLIILALSIFGDQVDAGDDYEILPSFPAIMVLGQDVLLDEMQRRRNQKIQQLFKQSGMTQEELGQAIGMDQSQLSKHLRGILPWREKWLARLSELWQVSLLDLLSLQPEELPVSAMVQADGLFPYARVSRPEEGLGSVPALLDCKLSDLGAFYVLRVGDSNLAAYCPTLQAGVLLYVEKRGGSRLRDGQLGVEVQNDGRGALRLVQVDEANGQVLLKAIQPNGPSHIYPRSYLQRLDRVAFIKL